MADPQRILLFYDNLIRDYRGLLLLSQILRAMGHATWLRPLWDRATEAIEEISPNTVVMGQIGEYSTSQIGYFVQQHNINLVLNSSEMAIRPGYMDRFFRCNFKEYNDQIVDLQVLMCHDLNNYLMAQPDIRKKEKFKFLGCPRMDLSVETSLIRNETEQLRRACGLDRCGRVFLYVSSFQFDDAGGQIDAENRLDMEGARLKAEEAHQKRQHKRILEEFLHSTVGRRNLLLIKKHPWDKSAYYEDSFRHPNCLIVDNFWYIAPLIAVSEAILHVRSTVAVEGWIQGKKTISILPDYDGNRDNLFNHMQHEPVVTDHDELVSVIEDYPAGVGALSLENFQPYVDGKATIRLAREIDRLASKPDRVRFDTTLRGKLRWAARRARLRIAQHRQYRHAADGSYARHLIGLERYRRRIDALYRQPLDRFIRRHRDAILGDRTS